jgi:hypothetical protein
MKIKAQNLVEYILIFGMVAVICWFGFASKFNLKDLRNLIFNRPASTTDASKIEMGAMTE